MYPKFSYIHIYIYIYMYEVAIYILRSPVLNNNQFNDSTVLISLSFFLQFYFELFHSVYAVCARYTSVRVYFTSFQLRARISKTGNDIEQKETQDESGNRMSSKRGVDFIGKVFVQVQTRPRDRCHE